ncbi:MAG: class II glutamine amidotransferase [Hyphomicrobiaceae bacterium]|nr:class II glutamine amidotransferase [Hyphomicrobiaceae bacterium]
MCRWIAYSGEPIFIEDFVTVPEQSLIVQSRASREAKSVVNGDGFGIGWYGDRPEPGVFRDLRPAWIDENLISLARQIRSRLFFAHVRASTGTAISRANCHPFSHGAWMFMHNGGIGDWDEVRRPIEAAIPDALYRHRGGTTDSEAIFLLLLANGLEQDPPRAFRRTLAFIEGIMEQSGIRKPLRFTATATDGETVYAVRYSTLIVPETLYVRRVHRAAGHLIASEPLDDGRLDWEAVPPQSLVTLGRAGLSVEAFRPVAVAA